MISKHSLYAVVAKKDGSTKMRFIHSFGMRRSTEELMDMVRKRILMDPTFRETWAGWTFGVMVCDYLLKLKPDGTTLMFGDEKREEAIA